MLIGMFFGGVVLFIVGGFKGIWVFIFFWYSMSDMWGFIYLCCIKIFKFNNLVII